MTETQAAPETPVAILRREIDSAFDGGSLSNAFVEVQRLLVETKELSVNEYLGFNRQIADKSIELARGLIAEVMVFKQSGAISFSSEEELREVRQVGAEARQTVSRAIEAMITRGSWTPDNVKGVRS